MPLYEYYCPTCRTRFETMRRMSERTMVPPCPKCESEETELAFSASAFLGGGGGGGSCGTNTWTGGG